MPRQAYVNGRYLPHRQAAVHIEDRGFQFADGVYEVVPGLGETTPRICLGAPNAQCHSARIRTREQCRG